MNINKLETSLSKFLTRERTRTYYVSTSDIKTSTLIASLNALPTNVIGPTNDFEIVFWDLGKIDLVNSKACFNVQVFHTYKCNANSYIESIIDKLKKARYKIITEINFKNTTVERRNVISTHFIVEMPLNGK